MDINKKLNDEELNEAVKQILSDKGEGLKKLTLDEILEVIDEVRKEQDEQ